MIAEELGISRMQFDQFLRMMQGGAQFGGGYHHQQQQAGGGWQQAQRGPTLEDACNVLGVKASDDATTIKRAYRKLMGEHHPDKLVAKGLPPEMMEMAKQKRRKYRKLTSLSASRRASGIRDPPDRQAGGKVQKSTGALKVMLLPNAGWVMVSVSACSSKRGAIASASGGA